MDVAQLHNFVLTILTAIITGGFVLVFVEIGNRKNRENDQYSNLMVPFMKKLTAYFRFISWIESSVEFSKPIEGYNKDFKDLLTELGHFGGRAIMSGGDYPITYFDADGLEIIARKINNVWYFHDKMNPCELTISDHIRFNNELIDKELTIINPAYLSREKDVSLISKVSGDFYTDVYQPIERETYKHEALRHLFHRQTIYVVSCVIVVMALLGAILFCYIPPVLLKCLTVAIIFSFLFALMLLGIDSIKQIRWHNMVCNIFSKDRKMKKQHKFLEPIGLALILIAFIWQSSAAYFNTLRIEEQTYYISNAIQDILDVEVDEALRDSSRYKGSAISWKNYDSLLTRNNSYLINQERFSKERDCAGIFVVLQIIFYILGSVCVIMSKVIEQKDK